MILTGLCRSLGRGVKVALFLKITKGDRRSLGTVGGESSFLLVGELVDFIAHVFG